MSSSKELPAVSPRSENCERIKKLGYIAGKHVSLYGEHFILVSDPFDDGECVAARAVSQSNPTERTIELPVSILAGWEDLFQEAADPNASELPADCPNPGAPS